MLNSGLPGAGGSGRGRPGHGLLVWGLPSSSGLGGFGSGSRHCGPDRRGSRSLVFLVLAAHAATVQRVPRSRSRHRRSTASKCSLHSPGPTPPTCVLHPGFWGLGDRCLAIGPTRHGSASSPPGRCLRRAGPPLHAPSLSQGSGPRVVVGKEKSEDKKSGKNSGGWLYDGLLFVS